MQLLNQAQRANAVQAEANDLLMEHECNNQEVILQMRQIAGTDKKCHNLRYTNWVNDQQSDPVLKHVVAWLRRWKDDHSSLDDYMKNHVSNSEHQYYTHWQKDLVLQNNLLYLKMTPARSMETVYAFVVLACKRQIALDSCHRYTGHQGRDCTLSLLWERFWWLGMSQAVLMTLQNYGRCKMY